MPRYGEHGDPTPRCAYCGKPEVKVIWSSFRRHYCSFECMAADQCHCAFLCSLCLVPICILMSAGILYSYITTHTMESSYIPILAIFDIFALFTAFTAYSGLKTEG